MSMVDFIQLFTGLAQEGMSVQNWTVSKIIEDKQAFTAINQQLNASGIQNFSPTTMGGSMSLVVELPERNQVLRVVDVSKENSPVGNPLMLQPDMDLGEIKGFRVQVFPKVKLLSEAIDSGEIGKKEALGKVMQLVEGFAQMGLFFWDVRLPNLCLTPHHDIKLLDPGSVCPVSERHAGKIGNDTHTHEDKFQANIGYLCSQLGEWTQSIAERRGRQIG